jgi:hypothetical protein
MKLHAIGLFWYVADILIVNQNNGTNIHEVLNAFNNMTPTMHFAMEEDFDNKITFLDIAISKDDNNIQFSTYRKPADTYITIPNDSHHLAEHELAAVSYLTKRLST